MRVSGSLAFAVSVVAASAVSGQALAQPYQVDAPPQTVAAGSIGGGWFVMGTALFDLFERNIEGLQYNTTPGGGVANPIAVQTGAATIAFSYTTNLFAAWNGDEPYEGEHPDLRGIVNFNVPSALHPWILADTGVTTLAEVAERQMPVQIDTGPRGTGGELAAARALEAHGVGYENIQSWGGSITHSIYREALDRMKDGHINMFMNDEFVGSAVFSDLTSSRDVVLLPMEEDAREYLETTYGYGRLTIPAGTYPGQDQDVPTTSQYSVLFAHADVPEDLIYAMTKLIFDNMEDLGIVHSSFAELDPALGPEGFPIPLHPGAERYYREIGVLN